MREARVCRIVGVENEKKNIWDGNGGLRWRIMRIYSIFSAVLYILTYIHTYIHMYIHT